MREDSTDTGSGAGALTELEPRQGLIHRFEGAGIAVRFGGDLGGWGIGGRKR